MSVNLSLARCLHLGAALALVAASTFASAGDTIKVTNNSKNPWCLRITDDNAEAILVQGAKSSEGCELGSRSQKLLYFIQPGETCTLQFKDLKTMPMKAKVGVVDQSGTEQGQITVASKEGLVASGLASLRGAPRDTSLVSQINTASLATGVLHQDAEDAVSINREFWSCPFE